VRRVVPRRINHRIQFDRIHTFEHRPSQTSPALLRRNAAWIAVGRRLGLPIEHGTHTSKEAIVRELAKFQGAPFERYLRGRLTPAAAKRVTITGALPRTELLSRYRDFDWDLVRPPLCRYRENAGLETSIRPISSWSTHSSIPRSCICRSCRFCLKWRREKGSNPADAFGNRVGSGHS